jgi:hypothetical protein
MIAEINAAYAPALIVLDGVEAFISGGPDQGELVASEVILAGTDRIALDAVGIALLRYFGCKTEASRGRIFEQEQIARAVDLGLGVDSPDKIEFVTGDPDSAAYSESKKFCWREFCKPISACRYTFISLSTLTYPEKSISIAITRYFDSRAISRKRPCPQKPCC